MLRKMKTNEGIQYEKLTPEEMKARGILGRLVGVCADFKGATRNGRKYSEQLWENVFNNPIMQEKIKNGVCFGELGHPEERTEIDMEKIAVCLREQPVKNDKGQLCACFDILDTPNGRILKTLCDYGSVVGVSSRGQGDLITDNEGNEAVDPDTYECECFDVVLVPAVESARMQYVKESLDSNKLKLKKALTESLNKASEEEKKIMKETLDELNIKLTEEKEEEVIESGEEEVAVENELPECDVEVEQEDGKIKIEIAPKAEEEIVEPTLEEPVEEIPEEDEEDDLDEALEESKSKVFYRVYVKIANDEAGIADEVGIDDMFDLDNDFHSEKEAIKAAKDIMNKINSKELELDVGDTVECLNVVKIISADWEFDTKAIYTIGTDGELKEYEEDDLDEALEDRPVEEIPEEKIEEIPEEEVVEEPLDEAVESGEESSEEPFDDIFSLNDLNDEEELPAEEVIEEPVEEEKSDADIFLDYLANNFDEEAVRKVCKILDIEVVEDDVLESGDEEVVNTESGDDINNEEAKESGDEPEEAIDNGDEELIESLQEALKGRYDLETSVKSLQEKLAVSDAKVNGLTEECNRYKKAVARLAEVAKTRKDLEERASSLEESLKEKDAIIEAQKVNIARLVKSRKDSVNESLSLNESVSTKSSEIATLNENLTKANSTIKDLTEKLSSTEKTNSAKIDELTESLTKTTTLKESYKNLANKAVNKYIDMNAKMLGVTAKDIKRKLGESYTLDDVDQVCAELKSYSLNISKLPFNVNSKVGVRVNESVRKSSIECSANVGNEDDEVDASLIRLANI